MPEIVLTDGGTGNMGVLTDLTSPGRFSLSGRQTGFDLRRIDVHFEGGAGTATLTIVRQNLLHYPQENLVMHTRTGSGVGSDVLWSVPETERYIYRIPINHDLVLVWANPNAPTMSWLAKVYVEPY